MTKSAVVFAHLQQEGSCMFGKILEELGFRMRTVNTVREGLENFNPLRPDLLIVMGGPIGVYQADDYPFLQQEIDILAKRIEADRPTLGICLGGQLMAKAMGAEVYPGGHGKEVGWIEMQTTEAGKNHPVRHLCAPATSMFHWHGDTFDMPDNTELIATTGKYKQAFCRGKKILGLQCHPEVTHEHLEEKYVMYSTQVTGNNAIVNVNDLRKDTSAYIDALNRQASAFMVDWLEYAGLAGALEEVPA